MDFLFDFSKDIILFTVFMNLWEMLIPRGKYSAYISLVLSFVLISSVINPIGKLFSDLNTDEMKIDFEYNLTQREMNVYDEKYYSLIEEEFAKRLKDEINNAGIADIKECRAQICANEDGTIDVEKIVFYIDGGEDLIVKEKIADFLKTDENTVFIEAG